MDEKDLKILIIACALLLGFSLNYSKSLIAVKRFLSKDFWLRVWFWITYRAGWQKKSFSRADIIPIIISILIGYIVYRILLLVLIYAEMGE